MHVQCSVSHARANARVIMDPLHESRIKRLETLCHVRGPLSYKMA